MGALRGGSPRARHRRPRASSSAGSGSSTAQRKNRFHAAEARGAISEHDWNVVQKPGAGSMTKELGCGTLIAPASMAATKGTTLRT